MAKKRISRDAVAYQLTNSEFQDMVSSMRKGIIGYKATRNDNITELSLMMSALFGAQFGVSQGSLKQEKISRYQEADALAKKCIDILRPFVAKEDAKRAERNKGKKPRVEKEKPKKEISNGNTEPVEVNGNIKTETTTIGDYMSNLNS